MSRSWFLGLIAFAFLVSGLVTLNGSHLALLIPILLYWSYALVRAPAAVTLRTERTLSTNQCAPGEIVEVRIDVLNQGGFLEELTLEDALPAGVEVVEGSHRHLVTLGAGDRFAFHYKMRGRRGGYEFRELRARASDTLGLLPVTAGVLTPGRVRVLPEIQRIEAIPIHPRRTRVYSGVIPARVGGTGVEFFGVRPHSPGEPTRRINWRLLARHPEALYGNEFQQERVADVAIVLDGRERANQYASAGSFFEYSVMAAGSLAAAFLQQGNRVGLLIYSHYLQWTFPGYGKVQRQRILETLSTAATGASQVFEGLQYLPTRLFPPESQIVFVSPLLEGDLATMVRLRARGYQVTVVAPDPVGFEVSGLPAASARDTRHESEFAARIVRLERRALMGRLRRGGVQVIQWDVSAPLDRTIAMAARYLNRWRQPV